MKNFLDQAEAIAECERLKFRAECLRVQVHAATGNAVAMPELSKGDDVLADVAALELHIAELQGRIGDVAHAVDVPAAKSVTPASVPVEQLKNPPAKMTLTQRVLAAKAKLPVNLD